jgi:poly(A) polymerase
LVEFAIQKEVELAVVFLTTSKTVFFILLESFRVRLTCTSMKLCTHLVTVKNGYSALREKIEEAMLPVSRESDSALKIVAELRAAGYEAYLAGGCVRDLLLGREPHDYDVATSAAPDVVLRMFPRTFAVGAHFGVVLVADSEEAGYITTEVATFRSDGAYSDGRHPDAVRYTTSAEEDVKRRDFTINGLLLDPLPRGLKPGTLPGQDVRAEARTLQSDHLGSTPREDLRSAVIDYVGGIADLEACLVRAIGDACERFEEDHLRMLRGVRFAARFGFEIEAGTKAAMQRLAGKTAAVSRERVRDELTKMLTEGHARRAFELLDETGLLPEVLPEIAKMKGVEQPPQYHPEGDVWVHTLGLLEQLEAGCPLTLAWGALLHDVGKPPTFRRAPDRIRFDGHVEVGVAMGAEICRRFRFSNEETQQILALVENHMRFADADRMRTSTLKRFFRLQGFDEHLALHRMDCLAGGGNLEHWEFVRERYAAMPEEAVRPTPLITGRELIAAGYTPGAQFKEMLRAVEDAQLEGTITTGEEALRLVRARFPIA